MVIVICYKQRKPFLLLCVFRLAVDLFLLFFSFVVIYVENKNKIYGIDDFKKKERKRISY
jgi:hypothetical protein